MSLAVKARHVQSQFLLSNHLHQTDFLPCTVVAFTFEGLVRMCDAFLICTSVP